MTLLDTILTEIEVAYVDTSRPQKGFINGRDTAVISIVIKQLAKSGYEYESDLTDLNYSVCSSYLFVVGENKYVLSISHVGKYASVLQVTHGGYGLLISYSDMTSPNFLRTLAKCLRRFGIVCPDKVILEHRIVFRTELCDPDEATVYNALFDDVVELPWK